MDLAHYLRIQAHANALANRRLHTALLGLDDDAVKATRVSFFPSLLQTLQHILDVDRFYIAALWRDAELADFWQRLQPSPTLRELAALQGASDQRFIAHAARLDTTGCDAVVDIPRAGGRIQRDRVCHVYAHLCMHQTHHRGQVHAMLSGTAVEPPQLDEFLMSSEAHLRRPEMQQLGWQEELIWGDAPA
jgi:uncharacterized damage-inducible protein DinB